jgi:hypothetical protein
LIWVFTVLWSIRLILRDRKQFPPARDPGVSAIKVGFSHPEA